MGPKLVGIKSTQDIVLKLSVADYQTVLVLVTTVLRGSNAILKWKAGNAASGDPVQVLRDIMVDMNPAVMMVSNLSMFWAASLTVANWASIIHATIRKGSKNPLGGLGKIYLVCNISICILLVTTWVCLQLAPNGSQAAQTWAMVGQLTLAIPELSLAILATIYGLLLVRMIKRSIKAFGAASDAKKRQLMACQRTMVIFITFALAFLIQAGLDTLAGVGPDWYYWRGNGGLLPVAPLDLTYAICSVVTNFIILFVLVKYEEVTQLAAEIAQPFVMFARKFSNANGYSKVPIDDTSTGPEVTIQKEDPTGSF